jgi:signal transduction histidine kinase
VIRKLERFVVDGLDWDSVPVGVRDELKTSEGLDWNVTAESYVESWDRKRQRIALSIMTLIGGAPSRTKSFWFNPALLEGMHETKADDVRNLLAEIDGTASDKVDTDLRKGLARVRTLLDEKDRVAKAAKAEASELRTQAAEREQTAARLNVEKETYRAQVMFLQSVAPTEVKDLLAFHHQISHDSMIVGNNLAKAIRALRQVPGSTSILENLEKASMANRRVTTVAQFASKANFRLGMKREPTDVPAFIEQYLLNVARDFTAAGLQVLVKNQVRERFEIKASRVELSILVDNLVSNAGKALAKKFEVTMSLGGPNQLDIRFADDGNGLSPQISNIEEMFQMGVTTTSGSGLGLFHARRVAESLDGKLTATRRSPRGMEFRLELTR